MKITHWFLPSKHNKFHPHILRPLGLLLVLGVLVIIPPIYNIVSAQQFQVLGYATNIGIDGLNQSSNQQRVNNGLAALTLNSKLSSAALAKAQDMMADDYWAHVAPDGTTPWDFITAAGYKYVSAGENLAKGFYTSGDVVDAWMASPTHRDNILNSSYKDVGFAVLDGTLQGYKTTLVVAMYGSEYTPPVAQTTPAAPKTTTTSTPTSTSKAETPDQTSTTAEPQNATNVTTQTQDTNQTPQTSSSGSTAQTTTQPVSNLGEVLGSALSIPMKMYQSLNWGQKASILIICAMILLFVLKHTLIWRQQRRGFKNIWLRSHPIGQASMLVGVLVITLLSGAGVVL